jgi:hypothetical protein
MRTKEEIEMFIRALETCDNVCEACALDDISRNNISCDDEVVEMLRWVINEEKEE